MKQGWRNYKKDKKDEKGFTAIREERSGACSRSVRAQSWKRTPVAGFTLIELMVIVAIIGLLSSVVITNLVEAREQARDAQIVSDMRALNNALHLYRSKENTYPHIDGTYNFYSDRNGSTQLSDELTGPLEEYISKIPNYPTWPSNGVNGYVYWTGFNIFTTAQCGTEIPQKYILMVYESDVTLTRYPHLTFNETDFENYRCIAFE